MQRERNVERDARRGARRPTAVVLRAELERTAAIRADGDAVAVGVHKLECEPMAPIGLGPRYLEDERDRRRRQGVGDVPAASEDEQLPALDLRGVGEHHRDAGVARRFALAHNASITRSVNASMPNDAAPSRARSRVRAPDAMVFATAFSMRVAPASSERLWRHSSAADKIAAIGFAIPFPAMSGAVPPIGS